MFFIVAIVVLFAISSILVFLILAIDQYEYPVCPLCGNNGQTRRVNGRKICLVHGPFWFNRQRLSLISKRCLFVFSNLVCYKENANKFFKLKNRKKELPEKSLKEDFRENKFF